MQLEQLKLITNTYKQTQPTHTLPLFENMEMLTLQSKFCLLILFLEYLNDSVIRMHQNKIAPAPAQPQLNSYNPGKYGIAYYFNRDGKKLRENRLFTADEKGGSQNFDDRPAKVCNTYFPQVCKRGSTNLFLWFCPLHGHCYGFHMIPGSEGRKDASASLYCYLEKPPKVVFYDFACSLSEYTQNRESGYFSQTRFFHDIFHGYSHKCSPAFRCQRLEGFSGFNTSICEQFNAFLQCIKASARLVTQEHFVFYVQFFISIWNKRRRDSFKQRFHIALAGNK